MLSERVIIKYSLVAAALGLVGLYITTLLIEPQYVPLQGIDDSLVGKVISTEGHVKSSYISNTSTMFTTIEENGSSIEVVSFNTNNLSFESGDMIKISGEVSKYKGKLEIAAREIEKI